MKVLYGIAIVGLGMSLAPAQASAQYPSHGAYGYSHPHLVHHDPHHYAQPQPYVLGYGAGYNSFNLGNSLSPPSYGAYQGSIGYPQVSPPVSSYYSNNYYGSPSHSHHSWHPGHFLSGHH